MKVKYQQKSKQKRNQIVSEQGPNGWPKPNLLKSTLEIIFATVFIPIVVVGIVTFTTNDFKLFNLMEEFILEWWNDR